MSTSTNAKRTNPIKVRPIRSKMKTSTKQPQPKLSASQLESIIKRTQANYESFRVLQGVLDKHCNDRDDSSIMTVAKRLLLLDFFLGYETESYTTEASSQLVTVIGDTLRDCANSLNGRIGCASTGDIGEALYSPTPRE